MQFSSQKVGKLSMKIADKILGKDSRRGYNRRTCFPRAEIIRI